MTTRSTNLEAVLSSDYARSVYAPFVRVLAARGWFGDEPRSRAAWRRELARVVPRLRALRRRYLAAAKEGR